MKNLTTTILTVCIALSCSTEPEKIEYGFDNCTFCEMTIVDRSHACLLVSDKGRTYKFDSIECMLRYSNREDPKRTYVHQLVANYLEPGTFLKAGESTFLISKGIPSPMGAFLSAVENREAALGLKEKNGGEILNWDEVSEKFN